MIKKQTLTCSKKGPRHLKPKSRHFIFGLLKFDISTSSINSWWNLEKLVFHNMPSSFMSWVRNNDYVINVNHFKIPKKYFFKKCNKLASNWSNNLKYLQSIYHQQLICRTSTKEKKHVTAGITIIIIIIIIIMIINIFIIINSNIIHSLTMLCWNFPWSHVTTSNLRFQGPFSRLLLYRDERTSAIDQSQRPLQLLPSLLLRPLGWSQGHPLQLG